MNQRDWDILVSIYFAPSSHILILILLGVFGLT